MGIAIFSNKADIFSAKKFKYLKKNNNPVHKSKEIINIVFEYNFPVRLESIKSAATYETIVVRRMIATYCGPQLA